MMRIAVLAFVALASGGHLAYAQSAPAPPAIGLAPSLPVLVTQPGKPAAFIAGQEHARRFRTIITETRLPTIDRPATMFHTDEFGAGDTLVASHDARVVAYSPSTGELRTMDAASGKTLTLFAAGKLPTGLQDLEVSASGLIVLAAFGETTRLVVVIGATSDARASWTEVTLPIATSDTAFSTSGLLLLNSRAGKLLEVRESQLPPHKRAGAPQLTVLMNLPAGTQALASWRGSVYVSRESDLLVFPGGGYASANATPIPGPLDRMDAIRVSDDYLIALDRTAGRFAVTHRPAPVTIKFQGDVTDTTERVSRLLETLSAARMLPIRTTAVNRDTVPALFSANGALPTTANADSMSAETRARLDRVFCRLNPEHCEPPRLVRGTRVQVPNLQLQSQRVTTGIDLQGKTVEEVLEQRLLPLDRPSDNDLLTMLLGANHQLEQTLDAKLFRLDYIPWEFADTSPIKPGTAVVVKDGALQIVGQWDACAARVEDGGFKKEGSGFDATLRTTPAAYLRELLGAANTIEVNIGDLHLTSARSGDVGQALKGSCSPTIKGATHVTTDVLTADDIYLRVRDLNAGVVSPTAFRTARVGEIELEPTKRPEWSAKIEQSITLGFRVVPVPGVDAASNTSVAAAMSLPKVLRHQGGRLNLPVTGWITLVTVPSGELRPGSKLRAIESRNNPLIQITPLDAAPLRTSSSSIAAQQPQQPPRQPQRQAQQPPPSQQPPPPRVVSLQAREEAGKQLRALIAYPARPPDASSVMILVAEKTKSVDRLHPDFKRQDGMSVWSAPSDDLTSIELFQLPANAIAAGDVERDFNEDDDHGTHVAGILASVGQPLGLALHAGLFLVPMEAEVGRINDLLDLAANGIPRSLANFSQTIALELPVQVQLGANLDRLHDRLLVVAATDNKGERIVGPVRAPIGWADGPNVIGVTATDKNKRILDSSDYSKRFVQLLAPAADVLSLAKGGAYAKAGGASQAAPQVAAAAALLMARGKVVPAHIKARLIATADWHETYEGKVWGGFLNVTRAISYVEANILKRLNQTESKSVSFHTNARLRLKRSIKYAADAPTPNSPESNVDIEWSKVLRIVRQQWLPENNRERDLYRIVYLNGDQVEIRKNVEFQPNQTFSLKACAPPGRDEPDQVTCEPLVPDQIDDYVARFPDEFPKLRFTRGIDNIGH